MISEGLIAMPQARLASLAAAVLVALQAATQTFAWLYRYHPALGSALRMDETGVYWPWMILVWRQRFGEADADAFALPLSVFTVVMASAMGATLLFDGGSVKRTRGWGGLAQADHAGLRHKAGCVLGRLQGRLLATTDLRPTLVTGGTRSGKGRGHVVPTLLSWTDSVLVHDPKGELWRVTAGWRAEHSHALYFNPRDPASARFNPLAEIRPGPQELAQVQRLVAILSDPGGARDDEAIWDKAASEILEAVILHVLYTAPDAEKTLLTVRTMLADLDAGAEVMVRTLHRLGPDGAPEVQTAMYEALISRIFERVVMVCLPTRGREIATLHEGRDEASQQSISVVYLRLTGSTLVFRRLARQTVAARIQPCLGLLALDPVFFLEPAEGVGEGLDQRTRIRNATLDDHRNHRPDHRPVTVVLAAFRREHRLQPIDDALVRQDQGGVRRLCDDGVEEGLDAGQGIDRDDRLAQRCQPAGIEGQGGIEVGELELEQINDLGGVEGGIEIAATPTALDQTLAGQACQGFPHGRGAEPDLGRQVRHHDRLARQEPSSGRKSLYSTQSGPIGIAGFESLHDALNTVLGGPGNGGNRSDCSEYCKYFSHNARLYSARDKVAVIPQECCGFLYVTEALRRLFIFTTTMRRSGWRGCFSLESARDAASASSARSRRLGLEVCVPPG